MSLLEAIHQDNPPLSWTGDRSAALAGKPQRRGNRFPQQRQEEERLKMGCTGGADSAQGRKINSPTQSVYPRGLTM